MQASGSQTRSAQRESHDGEDPHYHFVGSSMVASDSPDATQSDPREGNSPEIPSHLNPSQEVRLARSSLEYEPRLFPHERVLASISEEENETAIDPRIDSSAEAKDGTQTPSSIGPEDDIDPFPLPDTDWSARAEKREEWSTRAQNLAKNFDRCELSASADPPANSEQTATTPEAGEHATSARNSRSGSIREKCVSAVKHAVSKVRSKVGLGGGSNSETPYSYKTLEERRRQQNKDPVRRALAQSLHGAFLDYRLGQGGHRQVHEEAHKLFEYDQKNWPDEGIEAKEGDLTEIPERKCLIDEGCTEFWWAGQNKVLAAERRREVDRPISPGTVVVEDEEIEPRQAAPNCFLGET